MCDMRCLGEARTQDSQELQVVGPTKNQYVRSFCNKYIIQKNLNSRRALGHLAPRATQPGECQEPGVGGPFSFIFESRLLLTQSKFGGKSYS